MSILFDDIRDRYFEYNRTFSGHSGEFPYGTVPDGMGGEHIEISEDSKIALVATDRNVETGRRETYSIDELMYWIFAGRAESRGWQYEMKNRHPKKDSRRLAFAKALDEIEKISPEWRDRLSKEYQKVLEEHPFHDNMDEIPRAG